MSKKIKPMDPEEMGETESMKEKEGPMDHEVESAAHDMMRAEMHKQNPKMMKALHKHMAKKAKAIASIQDLKEMKNDMFTKKQG